MPVESDALGTVTDAATAFQSQPDLATTLAEVVAQAQRCLPEFEHVSVSRHGSDRRIQTLAATTETALAFDALQEETNQGPCLDAATEDDVVTMHDAKHEQRWPRYVGRALDLGLRSQLGVRLRSETKGVLGLNLYSTSHDDIDPGSIGVAEHFAVHAGIAIGHVREEEQLRTAIGTRTVIGTAVGILMERFGLPRDQAFAYLVRQSSSANRKLRVVAREIVDEADHKAGG
ncbi:GAF and ANTAR domain-containing protein [Nocardioides sp.]|uniref:GAF and ANTAR domain-containing protein n=1 Tax=Nocardioides sp. TaxID=35761 RepID=UPI002ED4C00A